MAWVLLIPFFNNSLFFGSQTIDRSMMLPFSHELGEGRIKKAMFIKMDVV